MASLKEQALAQYLATEEGRNAAQVSLISSVANGWLNLLADEELLELSRRTLATREESVRLTKLRLDSGAASELDYRQAESLAQAAQPRWPSSSASGHWMKMRWLCCWAALARRHPRHPGTQ